MQPNEKLGIAVRNLPGVQFLASARVGARDVLNASRVIATKAAVEKLQELRESKVQSLERSRV